MGKRRSKKTRVYNDYSRTVKDLPYSVLNQNIFWTSIKGHIEINYSKQSTQHIFDIYVPELWHNFDISHIMVVS